MARERLRLLTTSRPHSALAARPDLALFRHFPSLDIPWAELGEFPTPLERLPTLGDPPMFIKREDLSSPHYGGNKVRTLEAHMGRALAFGAEEVWATGAYGSNHAVASVIHGRRVGLEPGVMLWPQPPTEAAHANLRATLACRPFVDPLVSIIALPFQMASLPKRVRRPIYLMSPGGATPEGALAHVSAALEFAEQWAELDLPSPRAVVLAVGSTCTTAGLLAGLHIAAELGIGFADRIPTVHAVRVTPWPITSRLRIALYAEATVRLLGNLTGRSFEIDAGRLLSTIKVDPRYLGRGYGRPTRKGREAIKRMLAAKGPILDVVYSAKSGAAFFDLAERCGDSLVFWATKSTAPLPQPSERELRLAPKAWRAWLSKPAL